MNKLIYLVLALALINIECFAQRCFAWDSKLGSPTDFLMKKEFTVFIRYQYLQNENRVNDEVISNGYQAHDEARKNLDAVKDDSYYYLDVCVDNKVIRIYQADVEGNPVPSEIILRRLVR
jgi:hypothetical protein